MDVGGALAKILSLFALAPFVHGSTVPHAMVRSVHETAIEHPEFVERRAPVAASEPTWSEGEPILHFESSRKDIALHVPPSLALRDGRFDLVIHFHGPHAQTFAALDDAELGAAIVSVNLGEGGTRYGTAASAPELIDRLVAFAEREVDASGRAPDARVGRIALSSWSAGFGAIREILKRPRDEARVDAVLLADGLFTDWSPARRAPTKPTDQGAPARDADFEKVKAVIDFARSATEGDKLFVLTHTGIDNRAYPDAPRCADAMLRYFSLEKGFPGGLPRSARGAQPYATDSAGFHIWGFGGKGWSDHLAQHRAMGSRQFSALKAFWRTA
jgi:hypothetical protein